jgi:hypothetical protein
MVVLPHRQKTCTFSRQQVHVPAHIVNLDRGRHSIWRLHHRAYLDPTCNGPCRGAQRFRMDCHGCFDRHGCGRRQIPRL